MTQIVQQGQGGGNTVAEKQVDIGYNLAGQFASITRYADVAGTDLVAQSDYGYDPVGRINALTHFKDATTFAGYGFTWNNANRLTGFTNSEHSDEDADYDYDDAGQLEGADRAGDENDESYSYDQNGNRVEVVVPALPAMNDYVAGTWYFNAGSGTELADASGHENTGELHGSPTWSEDTPWAGRGDYSILFDSEGDYATVGGIGSGEFTISMFFKVEDVENGTSLFEDGFVLFYLFNGRLVGQLQNTSVEEEFTDVQTDDSLLDNTWYHAFLRYNGSTLTVAYYNLSSSDLASNPFIYSNKELATVGVGTLVPFGGSDGDVYIADVTIFHTAVSDDVIGEIRAGTFETIEYTTIEHNRLKSDGRYNYIWDAEGNLATRHNLFDGSYTVYVWDHRNRLAEVLDYDNDDTLLKAAYYTYDVFNRRIAKHLDTDGDEGFDRDEFYIYDGSDIVLDFVDTDGELHFGVPLVLTTRYVWGPAEDQLLAQEDYNAGGDVTVQVLWAATDHQGSVRDYLTFDGWDTTVAIHNVFDTFGNIVDGDPYAARYTYTGQEFDLETWTYFCDARYYDPAIGRFISEDFIWDGPSKYAYVRNAPTMYVDPSGLKGVVTGPSGAWDHIGAVIDVRDNLGFIIGTISVDYAPQQADYWVLLGTPGQVLISFTPGVQVPRKASDADLENEIENDYQAMDRVLASVGKDYHWLYSEIDAGRTSWTMPSRGYDCKYYNILFFNCRSYAYWVTDPYLW